jgi:Zinc carboxypeptidase
MARRTVRPLLALILTVALAAPARAQHRVTTPEQQFGHQIGDDYWLMNYQQLHDYWIKLAHESDRMVLDTIGTTSEGRPQIMAVISSPDNIKHLDHYRDIAQRLAKAQGVTQEQAEQLSQEGKAVVWIDGGLHATEVLGAQQLCELVYEMNDRTDPETLRILNDVILLAVHANPDGMDLVSNWYMRQSDPQKRSTGGIPVLYNKYAGHDDNRDFYMGELNETTNLLTIMDRVWYPQIVYNTHQTGPAGAVMFGPPFRDPFNSYVDPLVIMGIDRLGSAMHSRFVAEGKGGTTMRSGASYSTWWNGGLRTTPYFKNQIGLLTEAIGNPTPETIPFVPAMQDPHGDLPLPVKPGVWHFRQSIEYSMTADRAVLDYASRNRDHLLYNIWRMGENSIQKGSEDSWTVYPDVIAAAEDSMGAGSPGRGGRGGRGGSVQDYQRLLHNPARRDPRGFILPSDQRDFPTATKFVNTLIKNGVDVLQATADFTVHGKQYPKGSWVVKTDQAFRPQILDMFMRQDYPNDFQYPGGPPIPPYDVTGWTLAWQMNVQYDTALDDFDGPFQRVATGPEDLAHPPAGIVAGPTNARGYLVSHINDAFIAVNRVLKSGGKVSWYTDAVTAGGHTFEPGAFYLQTDRRTVDALAREKGLDFWGVSRAPSGPSMALKPVKIGLWDRYGGSMPSGWDRKILEDFEFDYTVLYPPDLDQADLSRYDVIIFEDGAIPRSDNAGRGRFGGRGGFGRGPSPEDIPAEYRGRLGNVTVGTTVPRILDYVKNGGSVIAIGSSVNLAYLAGLPVSNRLEENGKTLTRDQFYAPGTLLNMRVGHTTPLTEGLGDTATIMFDNNEVFQLAPDAAAKGVTRVGWFDSDHPLKSGWAWGQEHLDGGTVAMEANLGKGKIFLFSPPITFRSQPHGLFPLFFNGIYYGADHR